MYKICTETLVNALYINPTPRVLIAILTLCNHAHDIPQLHRSIIVIRWYPLEKEWASLRSSVSIKCHVNTLSVLEMWRKNSFSWPFHHSRNLVFVREYHSKCTDLFIHPCFTQLDTLIVLGKVAVRMYRHVLRYMSGRFCFLPAPGACCLF